MGSLIESYSLNELHRIAVPGEVPPSLFWALPVGDWPPGELDRLWRLFTHGSGDCHDFGLVLVKRLDRDPSKQDNINLKSLGANLSDLMPAGVKQDTRSSNRQGKWPAILILSGGYPQPGWGVLVKWPGGVGKFEDLIAVTLARLREKSSEDRLGVFKTAGQRFERWRLERNPEILDLSSLIDEILIAEKVFAFLREAQIALQAGEYKSLGDRVAALRGLPHQASLKLEEGLLQQMQAELETMRSAVAIAAVPQSIFATEIAPRIAVLIEHPDQREAVLRSCSSNEVRHALRVCVHLKKHRTDEIESLQTWAQNVLAKEPRQLKDLSDKTLREVEFTLVSLRGQRAQREHVHALKMRRHRENSEKARESFHLAMERAAEGQWEVGPEFLFEFEQTCRGRGLWTQSIPWDPSRMVGWKLMASNIRLSPRDLDIAAREVVPGGSSSNEKSRSTSAIADGSYFTDYVHFIAISKPGFSPRTVTRDLLVRLLRPAELISLIEMHGMSPTATDAPHLADELLCAFGWPPSDEGAQTASGRMPPKQERHGGGAGR